MFSLLVRLYFPPDFCPIIWLSFKNPVSGRVDTLTMSFIAPRLYLITVVTYYPRCLKKIDKVMTFFRVFRPFFAKIIGFLMFGKISYALQTA
jgi:hypothetical protein